MTIEFRCVNPECRKLLSGPDDWAGQEINCPTCDTPQAVPATQAPPPIEATEPAVEGMVCPQCRQVADPGAASCPACGTVLYLPDAVMPPHPADRAGTGETPQEYNVLVECIRSVPYAFSNWSSIFKLVRFFVLIYLAFNYVRSILLLMFLGPMVMKMVALLVILSFWVTAGGYFLRFYLDCGLGGLERLEQAPNVPEFNLKELFHTGLRGLAMAVVFVLPLVTIPLLPLAYLSLAYNNDHRAFNPLRALHAAGKCPGALAGVWLVIICLFSLTVGLTFLVMFVVGLLAAGVLASGGCFMFLLLAVLTGLLLAFIWVTFSCMCFYCFGVLGRHRPATIELLSKPGTAGVSAAWVCGGAAVSILVMIQLGAWLRASAEESLAEQRAAHESQIQSDFPTAPPAAVPAKISSRLKKLSAALKQYRAKNAQYPNALSDLVQEGLVAPSDLQVSTRKSIRFGYVPWAEKPEHILVYNPIRGRSGRRDVILVSGEVRVLSSSEFTRRMPRRPKVPPTFPATRPSVRPRLPTRIR